LARCGTAAGEDAGPPSQTSPVSGLWRVGVLADRAEKRPKEMTMEPPMVPLLSLATLLPACHSVHTMKIALIAFQGEAMCFAHVLLNALDMDAKGHDVAVIMEGAACKLIPELGEGGKPFAAQYAEVRDKGLIKAVCKACSAKMGGLEAAQAQGLPINGDMSGHPPLEEYAVAGYQLITF